MSKPEEWSPEVPVTLPIIQICLEVKKTIKEKIKISSDVFVPVSCKVQTGNGAHYLVKVYVGEDLCVHALIYKAPTGPRGELTVKGALFPKAFGEPLLPF